MRKERKEGLLSVWKARMCAEIMEELYHHLIIILCIFIQVESYLPQNEMKWCEMSSAMGFISFHCTSIITIIFPFFSSGRFHFLAYGSNSMHYTAHTHNISIPFPDELYYSKESGDEKNLKVAPKFFFRAGRKGGKYCSHCLIRIHHTILTWNQFVFI